MNDSKFAFFKGNYAFISKLRITLVYAAVAIAICFSLLYAQDIGEPSEAVKNIIAKARELKTQGKVDQALDVLNSGRKQNPGSLHLNTEIYHLLMGAKRYHDCLDFINETYPTTPEPFKKYVLIGKRSVLLNLFWQELEERKDNNKAFHYLNKLAQNGYRNSYQFLNNPLCKPLHNMPGFSELISKIQKNAGIGKPPKDFTVSLTNGESFTLSKQTGKVILVDFWGTICKPCIKEFPNMRNLYKKYHHKGFEIVSINLDVSREKFESFLENEPLPFKHVFSGKGWKSDLVALYEVMSVPFLFLVDKKGIMRYFDVRGEQLAEAVEILIQE